MDTDQRQRLISHVARRQRLAAAGLAVFRCVAGLAAGGVLWLVGARLLSLWPERAAPPMAWGIGAGVLVVATAAWAFCRKPPELASARLIDRRTDSKDLFLTAAMIERSPGEYGSLVIGQAQERAEAVRAKDVLPFRWQTRTWQAAAMGAVVAMLALTLPHADPFGLHRQRQQTAQQQKRLDDSRKATQERAKALQQKPAEEPRVQEAIAKLEDTFKKAESTLQKENQQKLAENQKELGELWRQLNDAQMQNALQTARVEQAFGSGDPKESEKWKEALRQGDVSGLSKELEDMKKELKALAAKPDSAEKRLEQAQLQRKMAAMADGANKALQSPALSAALRRAMDQMAQGQSSPMSSQALADAAESLGLSQQELESLARQMKDLKNLDEALKSAQLAKLCNGNGQLDGKKAGSCNSIADYAKLYEQQLAQREAGNQIGRGMGQKGMPSRGGHAQENGGLKTNYEQEKSPTQMNGAKMEAQWQTSEVSEAGKVRTDDAGALQQNAQRVSEAINQEQVPPGYHQAIQKYFDTLPPQTAAETPKQP